MRKFQIAFYLIFSIISLYVIIYSFFLGVWGLDGPGAGFIPLIIGHLLIVSIIGIVIESGFFNKPDSKRPFWAIPGAWKPFAIVLGGTILMAALFEKAGYLLTVVPIIFTISYFIEKASIINMLIVPVAALVVYFLFSHFLGVKLPKGPLGF